jgi:hypothetical protein
MRFFIDYKYTKIEYDIAYNLNVHSIQTTTMVSLKTHNGGRSRRGELKRSKNQKVLRRILHDLFTDQQYMTFITNVLAENDDTCLGKLSHISDKKLEQYGISKDNHQHNLAALFRKACREAHTKLAQPSPVKISVFGSNLPNTNLANVFLTPSQPTSSKPVTVAPAIKMIAR